MTTQNNTNTEATYNWTAEEIAAMSEVTPWNNGPRTDVHRPSAINPEEYTYVCVNYTPGAKDGAMFELQFLKVQRTVLENHMERTGGTWSGHQHGGSCHVCGAHAMYTVTFYHKATNVYIKTGFDCAEKMEMGDASMFRVFRTLQGQVKDAREFAKGKQKAQAILSDAGLLAAWELWQAEYSEAFKYEENTVRDIVGKLVKYGSVSDKSLNYVRNLLAKIEGRAAIEAKRAEAKALAADVPTGRIQVEGTVVSIKVQDSPFGAVTKLLVQHATGWKVWGTKPGNLEIERGTVITFTATVTRSDDDPKFGFYSRPTGARVVSYPVQSNA